MQWESTGNIRTYWFHILKFSRQKPSRILAGSRDGLANLVGGLNPTPLKNMRVSHLGKMMKFPTEWKKIIHSCSKPPSSIWLITSPIDVISVVSTWFNPGESPIRFSQEASSSERWKMCSAIQKNTNHVHRTVSY